MTFCVALWVKGGDQVEWGIIQVTLGWEMVKKERLPDETLL